MSAAAGPDRPAVFVTHGVALEGRVAVKSFRSLVHGDEARREWRALKLLTRHAPGLAARPVSADLDILHPVFAQRDGNLANHLWDGHRVRLVDFEHSGRGDRAGELADFVEHISVWANAGIDADAFLGRFDLGAAERRRVRLLRRVLGDEVLPGGISGRRNPPGTLERQASRLLDLLG